MGSPGRRAAFDADAAARLRIAILRLARRLNRPGTAELTPTQLSALYAVDVWGPLRLGELGTAEGIAAPTLTRLIDHLEGRDLVRRERDAEDGRCAQVAITSAGHSLLDDLRRTGNILLYEKLQALEPGQRQTVLAALPIIEVLATPAESPAEALPSPSW
jgi:DNA-binding MarR family transcriptional regulator